MSRSLHRVKAFLATQDVEYRILETGSVACTAEQAASEIGCQASQIAKSIVATGSADDQLYVLLTPGDRLVDFDRIKQVICQKLVKADAATVRARTGFVIGGVSPFCHREDSVCFIERRLLVHETVWAAAGTPSHVVGMASTDLKHLANAQVADFC